MANTALNRTVAALWTNKSGGALAYGDVVILDNTNAKGFTTTTSGGLATRGIGVIIEPDGIANNATGMVATAGWIPQVNLDTAATVGQFIKTHTVAGQATPHDSPQTAGDFGYALQASATPEAVLFGSANGPVGGVAGPGSSTDNAIVRFDGAGGATIQDSAITVSDTGAITFPDNIRQTFNPGANAAGLNVGSIAGDPDTPSNGDIWYDSTANELTARINGASVALGAGGGGAVGDLSDYQFVLKASDESVTSSTALQSDDDLLVAIGASQTWIVEFTLYHTGATGGDIRVALNAPASATGTFGIHGLATGATSTEGDIGSFAIDDLTDSGAVQSGCAGSSQRVMLIIRAVVVTAGSSGNVTLRWAQGTSSGTATTVRAGSFVEARRVA